MEYIKDCTETELYRVLKKGWSITVVELRSFLGILYARGAYEARSLKASERLQTDKFALISEIWNRFIRNSQVCYKPYENISIDEQLFPTKARCRFTQYIPNKPHKFGIKFWLAVDVQTKYILNSFPYMGKDELDAQGKKGQDNFVFLTFI
ncbi:piggyBac transposable element-derived protein 4-like [Bombus bifarius]|uniref:PiggyBac transposable element-derived protein 4-like n=1 Tax=Bombus bifarius TaxID=103933 RepID=A0A6P8M827_9HYME|nr:piggyBac transposable element-derived protein 4-like [Bombus bifarius]